MQDPEKLREIEDLGEDDGFQEDEALEEEEEQEAGGGWGSVPLLQAVICALAVLALVFLSVSNEEKYHEIADWYRSEMSQELKLPAFSRPEPEPSQTPEPTATPAPPVSASAPLQML